MKKILFSTFVPLSFLISSCNNSASISINETKAESPKALQNQYSEISFRSGSEDMVEKLYSEIMDTSETLKKLDENINT